jgi:LmbE family N-acetylglucosaminyl deacetylase
MDARKRMSAVVYLSPHFDDVALSCGGAVHLDARAGAAPLVVTVCAAAPADGAELSDFCREIHAAMGVGADAVSIRRAEDRAAMQALGARAAWLDVGDAIYRRDPCGGAWLYADDAGLIGPLAEADQPLVAHVLRQLQALPGVDAQARFRAPLAVGRHVDHMLVHRVGLALRRLGHEVLFYEDFPYVEPGFTWRPGALHPRPLAEAIAALDGRPARVHVRTLDAEALEARVRAIRAYESQWPWMFDSAQDLAARVQRQVRSRDGTTWQERFWE